MIKVYKIFPLIFLSGYATITSAAVDLSSSRVIYHAENSGEDIRVKNNSSSPYLVQTWVDSGPKQKDTPFVTAPPLFRLNASNESKISIMYIGGGLPESEESLFWLNVKSIPSVNEKMSENKVILAVNHRVKLIFRPEGLSGDSATAIKNVSWKRSAADTLEATNDSSFYVTLNQVIINGKTVPISLEPDNSTLAPHSSHTYSVNSVLGEHPNIIWRAINDSGVQSEQFKKTI
ncbi:UNVERIFIED_ORG: P pilus assembly chaperone PapD [Buttiauxella agrestis ATCC 33320]